MGAVGEAGRDAEPFAAASDGSPAALTVLDRVATRFACGLATLLLLLDPGLVLIGELSLVEVTSSSNRFCVTRSISPSCRPRASSPCWGSTRYATLAAHGLAVDRTAASSRRGPVGMCGVVISRPDDLSA